MVLEASCGSLGVMFGVIWGVSEALSVFVGVSWDTFGDLGSTKKFVLELLMASIGLDVLFVLELEFFPSLITGCLTRLKSKLSVLLDHYFVRDVFAPPLSEKIRP